MMHNLHKIKIQLENLRHPNENAAGNGEKGKGRHTKSIKLNLEKFHARSF